MGTEKLKQIVGAVAETMNVLSRFANKEGLWVLIGLKDVAPVFLAMDWKAVVAEIKSLDEAAREALELEFAAKLSLVKKNVEGAIEEAVVTLEQAIDVIEDAVVAGKKAFVDGKAVYEKMKALVGA